MTDSSCDCEYRERWEEAARAALHWRRLHEELWDAVDNYRLWEPGRRGYETARRELQRVWSGQGGGDG